MIRLRRLTIRVGAAQRGDAMLLARLAGEALGARLGDVATTTPAATVTVAGGRTTPILARDIGHAAAATVSRPKG